MTTGIILAAGSGRRLKIHKPKGLLNIGGKPLIQYSINNLAAAGVHDILIVTGFAAESYHSYFDAAPTPCHTIVHNYEWEACGSLYSLYMALKHVQPGNDVVILDSDILYNRDEFLDFMRKDKNSMLVTNVPEGRHDACYVQTDIGDNLVKVSKNINTIHHKDGDTMWEYIGITQSGCSTVSKLIDYAEKKFEETGSIDHEYDYAFESIDEKYKAIRYNDYIWSEADDNQQLHYMITNTYPKITLY